MGLGSEVYERSLLLRGPANLFYDDTDKDFYLAYRGSNTAFLRFLASEDKDRDGEDGEGWVSDTVVLALSSKDSRLHEVLQHTDPVTRNYVCYIMHEYFRPADLQRYPLTMSLYDPKPFQKKKCLASTTRTRTAATWPGTSTPTIWRGTCARSSG